MKTAAGYIINLVVIIILFSLVYGYAEFRGLSENGIEVCLLIFLIGNLCGCVGFAINDYIQNKDNK